MIVVYVLAVIGAAAIAIVAWSVVIVVTDPHEHRCQKCGHAWRHFGLWSAGRPGVRRPDLAHTCRQCGTMRRLRVGESP